MTAHFFTGFSSGCEFPVHSLHFTLMFQKLLVVLCLEPSQPPMRWIMTIKHFILSQKRKKIGEKKAKVQDGVHNYLKNERATHPINHCKSYQVFLNLTVVIIILFITVFCPLPWLMCNNSPCCTSLCKCVTHMCIAGHVAIPEGILFHLGLLCFRKQQLYICFINCMPRMMYWRVFIMDDVWCCGIF